MPTKKTKTPVPAIYKRDYYTDVNGEAVMHWVAIDRSGGHHNILAARHLAHQPSEFRKTLADHMATLPTDGREALAFIDAAIARGPEDTTIGRLTERTGWCTFEADRTFVLPTKTLGNQKIVHRSRLEKRATTSTVGGTLKAWRKGLKKPCQSSPWLIFGLSLAFAGPTLRFYPSATGLLFNLAGESGGGKTSILRAAISTLTVPSNQEMTSTQISPAGLEQQSLVLNDLFLCIDEFGAALGTPKQAAALIHSLAYETREGRGKTRHTVGQKSLGHDRATWSISVLTSSENTLEAMMGDEKRERGAQIRYVDLPVPDRADGGAFPGIDHKKKGRLDGAALSRQLEQTIDANYGWALPEFVQALISDPKLEIKLLRYKDEFVGQLKARSSDHQSRYLDAFGKVFAAGRLAVEAGIAPFTVEQLSNAVGLLFDRSALVQAATEHQFLSGVQALLDLGTDQNRCKVVPKGHSVSNAGGLIKAVRMQKKGREIMFVPSIDLAEILPSGLHFKGFVEHLYSADVLHVRVTARTQQCLISGLVPGAPRPSGYMFDWIKLQGLSPPKPAQ